jgi:HSP20 family protein
MRGAPWLSKLGEEKGGPMTTIRLSPLHELDSMERQIRRAFEQAGFAPTLAPAADVYETNDEFVVELDAPGYDEKEIEIEMFDHTLVVKGLQEQTKNTDDRTFRLRERLERRFERRFALPAEADTDRATAKFVKGVLELHAPKIADAKPRKIAIRN